MNTSTTENDAILAYEPNCELRNIVGEDFRLADIVTDEKIAACEALLEKAAADFFIDAAADLSALRAVATLGWASSDFEALLTHTYNIKSFAKVLGFTLITDVCMHIVNTAHSQKLDMKKKQALLVQLIGTLQLTFDKQLRNDGGHFGQELSAQLSRSI
ncbi:MAG: hypothetical protein ACKVOE_03755 [Rickettsiales bacterium]